MFGLPHLNWGRFMGLFGWPDTMIFGWGLYDPPTFARHLTLTKRVCRFLSHTHNASKDRRLKGSVWCFVAFKDVSRKQSLTGDKTQELPALRK